jgi:hypothetical protein
MNVVIMTRKTLVSLRIAASLFLIHLGRFPVKIVSPAYDRIVAKQPHTLISTGACEDVRKGLRESYMRRVHCETVGERRSWAYLRLAPGARPHIPISKDAPVAKFEKIAAEYPVFRMETMGEHRLADNSQGDSRVDQ